MTEITEKPLTKVDRAEWLEYVRNAGKIAEIHSIEGTGVVRGTKTDTYYQYGIEIAKATYDYNEDGTETYQIAKFETASDRLIAHYKQYGVEVEILDGTYFMIKHAGVLVDQVAMSPTGDEKQDHDILLTEFKHIESGSHKVGLANRPNPNKSAIHRAKRK